MSDINPALERAAKALHRHNGLYPQDATGLDAEWERAWDSLFESQRQDYRDLVREVVKQIREPTQDMITIGACPILDAQCDPVSAITVSGPVWQAMIDELLK